MPAGIEGLVVAGLPPAVEAMGAVAQLSAEATVATAAAEAMGATYASAEQNPITDVTAKINAERYIEGHNKLKAAGLDADGLGSMVIGMGKICSGTFAELMVMTGHADELVEELLADAREAIARGVDPNEVVVAGLGKFVKHDKKTGELLRIPLSFEEIQKKNNPEQ